MNEFFKELFDYSHHCNQELEKLFTAHADKASEKSIQLFNHILNAHQVWNSRIKPGVEPFGVWQIHPQQEHKQIDLTNYQNSLHILEAFDLSQVIDYKTSKGIPFSNTVKNILFHVVNHSTYHRAQIATEFKQSGIEPLSTDYIFYKR